MYQRLVRWAFDRFYREFAWTYDTIAALVSAGQWASWAGSAAAYTHGRILELGCGTGNLQMVLAHHATAVAPVGLDFSPTMLRLTRRKLYQAGHSARLVHADARRLPLQPATFDTVVATFPSEYIAAAATLGEARRVLRPGGRLVVLLGADLPGQGLYQRMVALAYRLTLQHPPDGGADQSGVAHPAGARLLLAMEQAGFVVDYGWRSVPGGDVYIIIGEVP